MENMDMRYIMNYRNNNDDEFKDFEMQKKLTSNNIIIDRIEIYKDFTLSLLYTIFDTFLGFEHCKTENDFIGHFKWCFNKVIKDFNEEEIDFSNNIELYEYFYQYYINKFYNESKNESFEFYKSFWLGLFEVSKNKNKKIFDVFLELYEIFDKSIEKKHLVKF